MTEYFRKFDIDNNEEYQSSVIVANLTKSLAQSRDYELGYWMPAFMRLFSPGIYFRACNVFGKLENWQELRYLMEHAIFDPEHPLYGLDYETCTDEDKARLDVLREIARTCCYCGYVILKRERPNLLPKKERKPLTKKEEKLIRWMSTYYTGIGTRQERDAFSRYKDKFHEIYPPQTPNSEEIETFESYTHEIQQKQKLERREEALRQEAERLKKLPQRIYIAAHTYIKKQFREQFGSDNEFVIIHHRFEDGDLDYKGKLPATQELVVLLSNDMRSRFLLLYIAAHFHRKISIINIDGHIEECNPVELSKTQIRELKLEFDKLSKF